MIRRGVAAALLVTTGACYSYTPFSAPVLPADGLRVRAELTELGSAQLGPYLGPGVDVVEGTLIESGDRDITLAVAMTSGSRGENFWRGERATLPRDAIQNIQRRQFSRSRTLLASLGTVAGALLLASLFVGGDAEGAVRVPDGTTK